MRILSFHAAYACRHSGACCSAGWIDPRPDGICRHFRAHRDGSCTIQRAHGHEALPHACQQFPRVATLSPLGTSITLSAFCPTAASLLFENGPFRISSIADARRFEGLDARNVLPPILRPGMLMDWESVAAWEELAVATLSDHQDDVDLAIDIIEAASEHACATWTPADGSLADALTCAFKESGVSSATPICGFAQGRSRESGVSAAAPLKDRRRDRSLARPRLGDAGDMPDSISDRSAALARYLAAHAFACWPMYDGGGIRAAVDCVRKVRATLEEERRSLPLKEAFRQSDLRLRHATTSQT